MTKSTLLRRGVLVGMLVVAVASVRASDPCGVYSIIEKVVLEPNSTEPTSIQVWGVFALSDARIGGAYLPAQRGYLYYTCAKGRDTTCVNEWMDLKSLAGKEQVAGFGGRYLGTGRVRPANEPPSSPDTYPIQMGVFRIGPPAVISDLQRALTAK
jgi:hypothetical protein